MSDGFAKAAIVALALAIAATGGQAQAMRQKRAPRPAPEPATPAVPIDKRDSVVAMPGAFSGHPYWLALAQCGGIYFKLNILYTDIAVHARVVKPDPKAQRRIHQEADRGDQGGDNLLRWSGAIS